MWMYDHRMGLKKKQELQPHFVLSCNKKVLINLRKHIDFATLVV